MKYPTGLQDHIKVMGFKGRFISSSLITERLEIMAYLAQIFLQKTVLNWKQDRRRRYSGTFSGIRVTTVAMEMQQYVPFKACSQKYGKRLLFLSCLSVRPASRKNSAPTKRIIIKFDDWRFFENVSRKFQFDSNLTRITGILLEDLRVFMKCCWILGTRNVSDTSCGEYQNTHVNNFFLENCSVEKYGTVREMRIISCSLTICYV